MGYGQTELDKRVATAREKERVEAEKQADMMMEDEDDGDDTPLEPIRFEISNKEDLEKLRVFMKQHRRCRYIYEVDVSLSGLYTTYWLSLTIFRF